MINNGPSTLALEVSSQLPNPFTAGYNAPAACQVCNSSAFTLQVSTLGSPYVIQAFSAVTVPVNGNEPLQVLPIATIASASSATSITLTWLLGGESAPQEDGPLTAAAIAAAIAGTITFPQTLLASVPGGTLTATVTLPPNCETLIIITNQAAEQPITVRGVTSTFYYQCSNVGNGSNTFVAMVSPAIDFQVAVTITGPSLEW